MKTALLFSFMACGLLFASDDPQHLSGQEKIALRTSSPAVHTGRHKNKNAKGRADRVVSDKSTVIAFVPVGK